MKKADFIRLDPLLMPAILMVCLAGLMIPLSPDKGDPAGDEPTETITLKADAVVVTIQMGNVRSERIFTNAEVVRQVRRTMETLHTNR